MNAKPSIDAVARAAGVSIATVSRVLTGHKPVADATRAKVVAAIAALGFRASPVGRALSTGRTGLLLVLVPNFANPFHAEIVRGAAAQARARGWTLLPVDVEAMDGDDATAMHTIAGLMADGVVNLAPLQDRPGWRSAARARPWVNCSEFVPEDDAPAPAEASGREPLPVPHVSIDHVLAATDAVQYLVNRGHRRIALVNGDERHGYAHQRRQGWAAALARAGLAADPALVVNTRDISYAGGAAAAAVLLSQPEPPTAVFAVADALAIGVIKAMRRAGRRVPEDVAVVGFDDVPIAEVFEPGLTTIAQPMHALGAAAIDMLLERLAGGMPAHRVLPHRLVIRESA